MASPTRTSPLQTALVAAAVLSIAAGAIHVAAAASHFSDSALLGYGFLAVALLQITVGSVLLRGNGRTAVIRGAMALHLGAIAAWGISRTVGLPVGHPGPEAIGMADAATVVLQILAILVLLGRSGPTGRRRSVRAAASLPVAVIAILSAGATALALENLGAGHGHSAHTATSTSSPTANATSTSAEPTASSSASPTAQPDPEPIETTTANDGQGDDTHGGDGGHTHAPSEGHG